jgi:type IV secretory pathway VirB9-like protein
MPDAVNSVVLGDPESFSAEHSEREPHIVFVKPITPKPAQTNLLISTARGYQANLLLISRGEPAGAQPSIDFLMRYRPAGRFIIEPSNPSVSVVQTAALSAKGENPAPVQSTHAARSEPPVTGGTDEVSSVASGSRAAISAAGNGAATSRDSSSDLDLLLERQRKAPMPLCTARNQASPRRASRF